MPQNRASLSLDPERLERIDGSLTALEADLDDLIGLGVDDRRERFRMGAQSHAFCTTALNVAEQYAGLMPRELDIEAFRRNHLALELLRTRVLRLAQLAQRLSDTELALGSDVMAASLAVYGVIKGAGKDKGLDEARRELAALLAALEGDGMAAGAAPGR